MLRRREAAWIVLSATVLACCGFGALRAQEANSEAAPAAAGEIGDASAAPPVTRKKPPHLPEPEGLTRMPEPDRVWIDAKQHQVHVDGYVALRDGFLEMFACTVGTKEHESVVAVETKAATVHAALLAVGAREGHPVQFRPEFKPPTGTEVGVEVCWLDAEGKWQSARAQEWVREAESGKVMTQPWVFAGSGFFVDEETKKRYYMAESGDFICVSNFTTAMLDIPMASSDSNEGLMFRANTDKIPPMATPVRLVLTPVLEKAAAPAADTKEASKQ
jgi:hypothetical protein